MLCQHYHAVFPNKSIELIFGEIIISKLIPQLMLRPSHRTGRQDYHAYLHTTIVPPSCTLHVQPDAIISYYPDKSLNVHGHPRLISNFLGKEIHDLS